MISKARYREIKKIMEKHEVKPTKNKNISLKVKDKNLDTPEGKATIQRLVSKILDESC